MSRRCPTPEARAKAGEEFRRRSSSSVTTSTPSDEARERAIRIVADFYNHQISTKLIEDIASALSSPKHRCKFIEVEGQSSTQCETCGKTPDYYATMPSGIAQRARAAALEEAARIVEQPFTGMAHTEQERWRIRLVNDLARQIRALKHFTATDVEQGTCTWTCEPNPDIEMWETDCGNAFQFEVGGPTENKMQFCCYCGKRLAEKVAEGREEGQGDD